MSPAVITLFRAGLGFVALLILNPLAASRSNNTNLPITTADAFKIVLLGLLWVALPFTLFPLAEQHINSALTGLLNGTMPIFASVFAAIFSRSLPKGPQLLSIIVGFAGIVLITAPVMTQGSQLRGILYVLIATASYGISVNIAPPLQIRYGSLRVMTKVLSVAAAATVPYGVVQWANSHFQIEALLAVSILGILGTGAAYWIMGELVGRIGGVRASTITYLIPVVALVLGVLLRSDEVHPLAYGGALLAIGGAYATSRTR